MNKQPANLDSVLNFTWKLIKYVASVFFQLLGAFMRGFFRGSEEELRRKKRSGLDPYSEFERQNAHLKNNGK